MNTPSLFLPAPFALYPGAFAEFHREMLQPRSAVEIASEHYHMVPRADAWRDYCQDQANRRLGLQLDAATGIAIQPVVGRMMEGISPEWELYGGWFDTARVTAAARRAETDDAVRALVLYVDSPGGYTPGVREAALALRSVTQKPVLAYLKNAMSAAIFLAAGCQQRHAPASAELGSVGTFIVTMDSSRAYAVNGYDVRLFADGTFKGMGAEGVEWTQEWYDLIQARVAVAGKEFRDFLSESCPLVPRGLLEGQSYPASSLLRVNAVGPGHLIDTCPDDAGRNGFPLFDDLLAAIAAQL